MGGYDDRDLATFYTVSAGQRSSEASTAPNSAVATWQVGQLESGGHSGHLQLEGVANRLRSPQSHLEVPRIATHIDVRVVGNHF